MSGLNFITEFSEHRRRYVCAYYAQGCPLPLSCRLYTSTTPLHWCCSHPEVNIRFERRHDAAIVAEQNGMQLGIVSSFMMHIGGYVSVADGMHAIWACYSFSKLLSRTLA